VYSRRFRDRFHPRAITLAVAYSVGLAGALGVLQVSIARPASAGFLLTVNRDGLDLVVTAAGLAPGDDLTLVVPGVADQAATADGAGALQVRVDGVLPGCGRLTVVARTAHSGAGVGSWVDACLPFAPVVAATPQIIRVDDQGGYDVVGGGFVPQFPVQCRRVPRPTTTATWRYGSSRAGCPAGCTSSPSPNPVRPPVPAVLRRRPRRCWSPALR
jgi:hypothetical protein